MISLGILIQIFIYVQYPSGISKVGKNIIPDVSISEDKFIDVLALTEARVPRLNPISEIEGT